ncbi:MAG: ribokinase [Hahellaceae bacterium]|nr:ribokinase [Hahellaceae bacterium]
MNAHFVHVDRLPVEGESLAARRVFQEHGGKGFNLGVGLHRLGVSVEMVLPVGQDAAGAAVTQTLVDEGMDTRQVLALGDSSGFGVGFIAPDGRNFLAAHLGANALLMPSHVDTALAGLGVGDWLVAQFELPFETVRYALKRAHLAGVTTYLNPSPWCPLDRGLLSWVDILVVNETEAAGMFEEPDLIKAEPEKWAARLSSLAESIGWRGRSLVVTLGAAGSLALDAEGNVLVAEAPGIRQVDATGAGDAFGCGLVAVLAQGGCLADALQFGNRCGAYIAAREGILAHLPRREELGY